MKTKITSDRELWHVVAAHKAIDMHQSTKYHVDKAKIYTVCYRGKKTAVEVVVRKRSITANVLAGHRQMTKVMG